MLSATSSSTSPQTMIRPFCIMNPAAGPTLPPTISVPPFMAIPPRVEYSLDHDGSRSDRRCSGITGIAIDDHRPVSHARPSPSRPSPDFDVRAVIQARRIIPGRPFDREVHAFGHRHAQVMASLRVDEADQRHLALDDDHLIMRWISNREQVANRVPASSRRSSRARGRISVQTGTGATAGWK